MKTGDGRRETEDPRRETEAGRPKTEDRRRGALSGCDSTYLRHIFDSSSTLLRVFFDSSSAYTRIYFGNTSILTHFGTEKSANVDRLSGQTNANIVKGSQSLLRNNCAKRLALFFPVRQNHLLFFRQPVRKPGNAAAPHANGLYLRNIIGHHPGWRGFRSAHLNFNAVLFCKR